ncbi:MAG: OmpA family protein [Bdellovibrionaceae bacterium]|nr:OmpA family protein [Pseudobdellovibrionaceae bacterium]
MRHKSYFYLIFVVFFGFSGISCSYLQKIKDRFQGSPEIEGAEDLSSAEIESGNLGSDSGQIDGLSTVYFELDSSKLTDSVKETLKANKAWMDSKPEVKSLLLEGHCDPLGSEAYNIGLGERRAKSVYNYLVSIGLSADKINIISYGEEKIFSFTDNSLNRRVNFVPQY